MKPRRFLFQSARVFSVITLALGGLTMQASATTYQWDVNGSTAGLGGTGAWDTTSLFWDLYGTAPDDGSATTQAVTFTNTDKAMFGGTAGTVTLGTGITLNALQFDTAGYIIAGNTLTLAGTTPTIAANANATISSVITGSSGLTKTGAGTLILSGANTYKGTTTISAGSLQLNNTLNGGTYTNNVVNNATLVLDNNTSQTLGGAISGSGSFTVKNGSTLTFSGGTVTGGVARSFSGGNTSGSAAGGSVTLSNEILTPDQFVALTGGITMNIQNGTTITGFNNFHLGYTGGSQTYTGMNTVNMTGGSLTMPSTVSVGWHESGTLNQSGGTITVGSTAGGFLIRRGTTATGTYNLSGGLLSSTTSGIDLGNAAGGTWNFTGGTALVNKVITTTGTPTWNFGGGTLKASAAFNIASTIPINLSGTNGNAIIDTNSYAVNVSGLLSGAGGLTKVGTNTLTLNGSVVNTFTGGGGVVVNGGTLSLDYANLATPTDLIKNTNVLTLGGGTLSVLGKTGANTTSQTFASTTLNSGPSTINTVLNTGTLNTINLGAITRNAGSTLNITAATALTSTASTTEKVITTGLTYNGTSIALPGSGTKYVGAGIFANTGVNTRYAQVNASGQFLQGPTATGWISTGGDSATVYNASNAGSATAGAALTGATTTYATIFNWGTATTQALGSFNLTTNGILNIGAATTTISGAGNLVIGAEKDLVINTATTGGVTISSGIQDSAGGASSLTFTGQSSGVLSLNTTNKTYTGGTYVNSGTLSLDGGGGSSGIIRGTVNVATGATLRLNSADVTGYSGGTDCIRTINLNGGTLNVNTGAANQTLGNTVINMTGGSITGAAGSTMDFYVGSSAINTLASTTASTISTTSLKIRQSAGLTITVADGTAVNDLQIDSVIGSNSNFASAPLIKSGAGLLQLNGVNTYTGATTINAGTLQIGSAGSLGSGTYSANITNNGTLFKYSSSANQTLSGVISGSGALMKDTGAGTLTLSGNNTYTGATTISAGRLNLSSATNASSLTLNTGATLGGTGSTTGGLTTFGGTIALNGTTPSSGLSFGGAVNFAGATTINFDVAPTSLGNISHTIVAYGSLTNGISNLTGPTGYRSSSITDDTVNKKVLFNYSSGTRTWNRTTAGSWDGLSTQSWAEGDLMFASGDAVVFDDTATNGAVNLTGTLLPSSVTFNNSSSGTAYVLSGAGVIGGGSSVVKNGTGTVTLQTANSYTGGTTVNAGTLVLNSTSATWNVGIIRGTATVNNGATLEVAAGNNTAPTDVVNVNGGGTLKYSQAYDASGSGTTYLGTVNLSSANGTAATVSGIGAARMGYNANGLITSTGSVANTWSANIQTANGSGYKVIFDVAASNTLNVTGNITQMTGFFGTPLVKNSPGTLVLSGNNGFTGGFTINDGVVRLASSTAFPSANALTMTGTSTLELNNNSVSLASLSGTSTNTITNNASASGTATLSIAGAGSIATKLTDGTTGALGLRVTNSTGNFTLTNGSNNFSGGIVLTAGGTRMSTGPTITAGAYGTGAITVGEAATDYAQIYPGGTQTLTNNIISNTNLGTDRVGTFRVDVSNFVLSGTLTANLAPMTFGTNGTGTMSATGQITGPNGLMLLSSALGGTSLTVTLNNAAENNDYAGDTTINSNAQVGKTFTLALGRANQIANGLGKGNVVINTNGTGVGTLSMGGYSDTINGLSGNGTVDGVSGTPTLTLGDGNASATFSGDIKNTAGALALNKIGSGSQTLTGASTFSGGTTLTAGSLVLGNVAALGAVGRSLTLNGGTLDLHTDTSVNAYNVTVGGNATIEADRATVGGGIVNTLGTLSIGANTLSVAANSLHNVTANSTYGVTFGATTLTGNATFDVANNGSGIGTLTLGAVGGGSNGLTKTGSGQLSLNSTNTYTGGTTVNAGTLALGHATNTLADTGFVTIDGASAILDLGSNNDTVGAVSLKNGGSITGSGTLTGTSYAVEAGTISANLAGDGSLVKSSSGTVTLSGTNSYTGGTEVNAGRLNVSSNANVGSGSVVVNGGELNVTGSFSHIVTLNGGKVSGNTETVAVHVAGNAAMSGVLGAVDTGTSAVRSIDATGGVSFASLSGQATFSGGAVTISGAHAPGNSPGTQTFNDGLTYANGATLNLEIAADGLSYDQIIVHNGLTIGTGVNVAVSLFGTENYQDGFWDVNHSFTLLTTDTATGAFASLSDSGLGLSDQGTWSVTQDGGNVVATWTAMTQIPEASSTMLLAFGALGLTLRRRRNS